MPSDSSRPTDLLLAWGRGDAAAFDRLVAVVHDELHRMARRYMARERAHTLQPTALINEVYLRLIEIDQVQWRNRAHFFAMAARAMRRILVLHFTDRSELSLVGRGSAVRRWLSDAHKKVTPSDTLFAPCSAATRRLEGDDEHSRASQRHADRLGKGGTLELSSFNA
jgi:RNA polymerase sigma factor (TIGR02999 family)